jgi:PAS domain S-box-containing protein
MVQLDEHLLERLNTLFIEVDKRGVITHAGSSVKKILGYEPFEIIGTTWWSFTLNPEDFNETSPIAEIKYLLDSLNYSDSSFERKIKTSNGDFKWVQWNISKNDDGSIVGLGRDITRRKQSEEQVRLANIALKKKHQEVLDSIEYARKLQESMLPSFAVMEKYVDSAFALYKPKDIVAGDFYWLTELEEGSILFAAADMVCQGQW